MIPFERHAGGHTHRLVHHALQTQQDDPLYPNGWLKHPFRQKKPAHHQQVQFFDVGFRPLEWCRRVRFLHCQGFFHPTLLLPTFLAEQKRPMKNPSEVGKSSYRGFAQLSILASRLFYLALRFLLHLRHAGGEYGYRCPSQR